jgi:hypothetical protein
MYAMPRSKKLCTCVAIPWTFSSNSSGERALLSVERPEGSPMEPVAPPIYTCERWFPLHSKLENRVWTHYSESLMPCSVKMQ